MFSHLAGAWHRKWGKMHYFIHLSPNFRSCNGRGTWTSWSRSQPCCQLHGRCVVRRSLRKFFSAGSSVPLPEGCSFPCLQTQEEFNPKVEKRRKHLSHTHTHTKTKPKTKQCFSALGNFILCGYHSVRP